MIMTLNNNGALWTIIWLLWLPYAVLGMMASPHAFTVDNANLTIALRLRGDEKSHWLTDLDGKNHKLSNVSSPLRPYRHLTVQEFNLLILTANFSNILFL